MRAFSYLLLVSLAFSAACYSEPPTELPADLQLGVPLVRPDLKRAESLFQENCEACHGKTGKGDGWRVEELSGPRPRNFQDPAQVLRLYPTRAFESITNGVERTSMTAFKLLSNTDRWNLAFYVMSLGHTKEDAAKGADSLRSVDYLITTTAALADVTNKDVTDQFIGHQKTEEAARQGLAYLRLEAPFSETEAPLADMRSPSERTAGENTATQMTSWLPSISTPLTANSKSCGSATAVSRWQLIWKCATFACSSLSPFPCLTSKLERKSWPPTWTAQMSYWPKRSRPAPRSRTLHPLHFPMASTEPGAFSSCSS
jgi:hypothetical protein